MKESRFSSGRLPVLDGFIAPTDLPLNRFQRAYFQCETQVVSTPSGGSMVRVNATITAWYTDPVAGKSGYQVLPSNGRLENDFLDRLQEELGSVTPNAGASMRTPTPAPNPETEPTISAPAPGNATPIVQSRIAPAGSPFNLRKPLDANQVAELATEKAIVDKHTREQEKEASALEEILQHQVHPGNLAAVKKAQTPVFTAPSQGAKVLFQAAEEDEFEVLDSNPNWVHVRISGLSRGWIRRSSLEMPGAGASAPAPAIQPEKQTPG
ncbi:MAG: SH3 domain-containing protein, partial [Terriglobales bacterium]